MIAMLKDPAIWAQFLALLAMLYMLTDRVDGRELIGFSITFLTLLFCLGWVFSRPFLVINGPVAGIGWRDVLTLALAGLTASAALDRKYPRPFFAAALAVPASLCVADHLELMVLALFTTLGLRAFGHRNLALWLCSDLRRLVMIASGLGLALQVFGIAFPRIALGSLLAAIFLATALHALAGRLRGFRHASRMNERPRR